MRPGDWVIALHNVGFDCYEWKGEQGGSIVFLNRGARILGIYPNADSLNALRVDPDLAEMKNVQELKQRFLDGSEWNKGGERTWINPEMEYFVEDSEHMWDTYRIPETLDPGSYKAMMLDHYGAII